MSYQVQILEQAEQDILDIYYYIAREDDKDKAFNLLEKLEEACLNLSDMPERGMVPHELNAIGITDYLQINCFSYRILYQIELKQVFVHAIFDGRRDMQQLLEKRLLRRII